MDSAASARRGRPKKSKIINKNKEKELQTELKIEPKSFPPTSTSSNNNPKSYFQTEFLSEDEYSCIAAQTATNLKAFRALFSAELEDSNQIFTGYTTKEIGLLRINFRKKRKLISREISLLESEKISLEAKQKRLIRVRERKKNRAQCLPSQLSPSTTNSDSASTTLINLLDLYSPDNQFRPESPETEPFTGFMANEPLIEKCHAKSQKLLTICDTTLQNIEKFKLEEESDSSDTPEKGPSKNQCESSLNLSSTRSLSPHRTDDVNISKKESVKQSTETLQIALVPNSSSVKDNLFQSNFKKLLPSKTINYKPKGSKKLKEVKKSKIVLNHSPFFHEITVSPILIHSQTERVHPSSSILPSKLSAVLVNTNHDI